MILVGHVFQPLGVVLLWIAGVLTFWTGYLYFQKSLDYVKSVEGAKTTEKTKTDLSAQQTQTTPKIVAKSPAKKTAAKKTPAKKSLPKATGTKAKKTSK